MSRYLCFAVVACAALYCQAQPPRTPARFEAEYYVAVYAQHYGVPIAFVRAIVQQESGWRRCAISHKGAVGLMQLMPSTAARLGVRDRCDIRGNISGGLRYLAWLIRRFQGDLRLAAAGYIAGEELVARRGLGYRNPEVVAYVSRIRAKCRLQLANGARTDLALRRSGAVR